MAVLMVTRAFSAFRLRSNGVALSQTSVKVANNDAITEHASFGT